MASSAWVSRLVGVPPMLIPISVLTALLLQIYPFQYEFSTTVQFLINPGVFFSIAQFTLVVGVLLTKRFGCCGAVCEIRHCNGVAGMGGDIGYLVVRTEFDFFRAIPADCGYVAPPGEWR